MPTTNPVPSTDPTDLLFNAGKLDEVVNGSGSTYTDRLGVTRRTLGGIDAEAETRMDAIDAAAIAQRDNIQDAADLVLAAAGYAPPVAYAAGISMTLQTQTVSYNGDTYAPKQSELPFTTSGTFETAKFRLIQGVASAELASDYGTTLIGHKPSGTGAAHTTVDQELNKIVYVTRFGASPAASASDNAAAIQAAADYCEETGQFLRGVAGTYNTNGTLTINCSGDLSDMTLNVTGATVAHGVRVGKTTGSVRKLDLKLPKVKNSNHVSGDGWATYYSNAGVSIDNLYDSQIFVPEVTGFGIGVYAGGVDAGLSYCNITLGYIADNKVNLKIGPKTSAGWSNANTYNIGRCRHNSAEGNGGVPFAGTRNIVIEEGNDNLLLKPSIEGSSKVTEFALELINANYNTIIQPRWEDSASGGGSTMKVRLEGIAPSVCSGNLILGGYEFGATLDFILVGSCGNNTKLGAGRGAQSFSLQNPICISNNGGDGVTQPHLQGFTASINPLDKSSSATNYNYRLYASGLEGKRSTDENPRVRIDWSTAGLYLGAGGTNPITYKIQPLATIGLATNSDWMPSATNTYDLGISSYRWQDCFLVNAPNVSSDANTKQQVREMSEAEKAAAIRCKGLIRAYKLNSSVAEKGDNARIHFGAIAQDIKSAFEAEGLDPFAYGLLCYDQWDSQPEERDEDGNVVSPGIASGQMYSLRYEELLAFIIAAL